MSGNAADGYTLTYTYTGGAAVTVTVTKKFADTPGNATLPAVALRLTGAGDQVAQDRVIASGTATSVDVSWTGLKTYAPDGTAYAYGVEEVTVPDGYTVSYGKSEETGTLLVTNTYTGGADITVKATKRYAQTPNNATLPAVTLRLTGAGTQAAADKAIASGTATSVDVSWTGLKTYAPDGSVYAYGVEEVTVPDGYKEN